MLQWLGDHYLLLKAFHIVFVIAWMAGLLYLPRLFVYHAGSKVGSEQSETFKVMEGKLLKIIMFPSLVLVFASGVVLIFVTHPFETCPQGWFHLKLFLVFILILFQGYFYRVYKKFKIDQNLKKPGFFRMINEIPALLMIFIVFLVVMKPF
jgi:putative membrane protein